MSLLHGPLATLLTTWHAAPIFREKYLQGNPWQESLRAPNTPFQDAVVEFSIAYFIADLLHYVLFVPDESLFILHHVASATYMLSCRYYTKHGAFSIMLLLGLAESTSLIQNAWSISSLAQAPYLHSILNTIFLPFFTLVRGFLGPVLTWHLCVYYFSGHAASVIPMWLSFYWMFVVVVAITGSIYWVFGLWSKQIAAHRAQARADAKAKRLN
ncbi:hypothetical protein KP509_24G025700 [Ceratopteris richardii]|nr:hypothetical protein KP509_24G025700 [Ceratopteris richardii]